MRNRRVIGIGAALAVLSGLGAWAHFRGEPSAEFRTVRVDRGEIVSAVSATGNLNAVVTVQVGAQVSGNIKELYANFNTRVKKEQLVARIESGSNRFIALRRFSTGMGFSSETAATCPSACTPASVRPEPSTCTGRPSISSRTRSSSP